MNFYTLTSKMYDVLDMTYFHKKGSDPRVAINKMIRNEKCTILDMCCGTMANSIPIAKQNKNAKILGVDLSKPMLQVARRKIRKSGLNNIFLKCLDATNTEFESRSFDYVVIGLALHEMNPKLQGDILSEAYRLLKDDGNLIILEWEKPSGLFQKIIYFPVLIAEQALCRTFLSFYHCDKKVFFEENQFDVCDIVHCNYSVVYKLKKVMTNNNH